MPGPWPAEDKKYRSQGEPGSLKLRTMALFHSGADHSVMKGETI